MKIEIKKRHADVMIQMIGTLQTSFSHLHLFLVFVTHLH